MNAKKVIAYNFIVAGMGLIVLPLLKLESQIVNGIMVGAITVSVIGMAISWSMDRTNWVKKKGLMWISFFTVCISTGRWFLVDILHKDSVCGILLICSGTMLLLIANGINGMRNKVWENRLQKGADYFSCFIGIPFCAFTVVLLIKAIL